jgi:hypothetical protein
MFEITRLIDKPRGCWKVALLLCRTKDYTFIRIDVELKSYGRRMLRIWLDSCVMYS